MIVNCMVYRSGHPAETVDIEDISEVIQDTDAFIWLGLWQPEPAFMYKVQEEFGLHDLAVEDALNAHQRPKIERYGSSAFIVVKTVSGQDDNIEFGETHLFVGRNFLITVRHGASVSYAPIRARAAEAPDMLSYGPAYPLYCILDFIVDSYAELTARLNTKIGDIEATLFHSEFDREAIQDVYSLHVVTDVNDMRELLSSAMHVNLALVSVQQNEVVKKLAGWGAILVIPTVVFSMYGMNFEHMPELKTLFGYPATVAVTLGACVLLWLRLKRSRWL